jgi:hypothetical protein
MTRQQINIRLPQPLIDWLREQPEGLTGTIETLIYSAKRLQEIKMENETYYPTTTSLNRDDYPSEAEYKKAYQDCCKHYGFKVRVDGGWRFFEFQIDYETWKNQK